MVEKFDWFMKWGFKIFLGAGLLLLLIPIICLNDPSTLLMYIGISGLLVAISVLALVGNMLTSKILFDMWAQQIEFYTLFAKFSRALAEYFSSKKRGRSNAKKK